MSDSFSLSKRPVRRGVMKVPQITIYFWVLKLLTTAMGEATSDYLVYHINPFIAVSLGAMGLSAFLYLQFRVRRYIAWVYWLVVVMVSIFGTMVADATHIVLGVPYFFSTTAFLILLAVVFITWYKSEKTLSIHSISTQRRETFYWVTVLATFALGTATGDMTATTFHLGYLASGVVFIGLFAIPGLLYWIFDSNEIFTFWFAYVLTRPLGASFADWFGMPRSVGGLGYGKGWVSTVLTIAIVLVVGYLTITRKDVQPDS